MCLRWKHLGVHVSEDLSWPTKVSAHQAISLSENTKESSVAFKDLCELLLRTYGPSYVTAWYGNCFVADRKVLQRVVKTAQYITGTQLPRVPDIHRKRCLQKAQSIIKNTSHPIHGLLIKLPSGRRYRCLLVPVG